MTTTANRLLWLLILLLPGDTSSAYPLRDATECRVRNGLGNVLQKLEAGEEVRIAYLGGSITAQAGWRLKSFDWLKQQYPKANLVEINAAIGGTGSDLGVFRLDHDVLRHKPDLLFVEFAVNDGGATPERIHKAMEGIVRKTWRANAETDICFVYTLTSSMLGDMQRGKFPRAASAMEELADRYGIPSIHMAFEAARLEAEGKLLFKADKPQTEKQRQAIGDKIVFSPDGVHPYTDTGHQLYLEAIIRSMDQIRRIKKTGPHELIEPLRADNWEQAKMIALDESMLSDDWRKMDPARDSLAGRFSNRLGDMFMAKKPGASIRFRFRGTTAKIYDLLGPDCGQVIVRLDDRPAVVKPRFDAYCTYHRLATLDIASDLPDETHSVVLEIHPEQPDKAAILAKRNEKIDDPGRFDNTAWYAGAILLIGELVQ